MSARYPLRFCKCLIFTVQSYVSRPRKSTTGSVRTSYGLRWSSLVWALRLTTSDASTSCSGHRCSASWGTGPRVSLQRSRQSQVRPGPLLPCCFVPMATWQPGCPPAAWLLTSLAAHVPGCPRAHEPTCPRAHVLSCPPENLSICSPGFWLPCCLAATSWAGAPGRMRSAVPSQCCPRPPLQEAVCTDAAGAECSGCDSRMCCARRTE